MIWSHGYEPLEDSRFGWPGLEENLARHPTGGVAERERDDDHVVEGADDWNELRYEVDR